MDGSDWGMRLLVTSTVAVASIMAVGAIALAAVPSAAAPDPAPLAPRSAAYVVDLPFGGRARSYRLHVPPVAARGARLPLVLNLHGATQNGLLQEVQSQMDVSADRSGYLVAYPDGTRISEVLDPDPIAGDAQYGWNAGQ